MKIEVKNQSFLYLTDDSSEATKNSAFVITNQNQKYIEDAKKNGCKTLLHVKDCFTILDIKNIKIVGITGTNGKTTTASAICSILLNLGYKVGLQGTRGAFINDKKIDDKSLTTPSILHTLCNISKACKESCDFFVMEVSSHAIAQDRIEDLIFSLKIFTNISQDHLDFHKTMQEYINVKNKFFEDETLKLINSDDLHVRYNKTNTFTYGILNSSDFKVLSYDLKNTIEATCKFENTEFKLTSKLRGKFNLYNILVAFSAVYLLTKKDFSKINKALQNFNGVSGRVEVVSTNPLVIVDFAHTPDGIEKILEAMKENDMVVVFGAGGDRDKTKRHLMGQIAQKYAKKIYLTSDNPRSEEPNSIIEDILSGIKKTKNIFINANRQESIEKALDDLKENEVLLILGKGDEDYQEIKGVKYHFSDKEVVRNYLKNK